MSSTFKVSNLVTTANTASTSKTTGSVVVAGGVGIAGDTHTDTLHIVSSSTSPTPTPLRISSSSTSALNIATFLAPSASSVNVCIGRSLSGSAHVYIASLTDTMLLGIGGHTETLTLTNGGNLTVRNNLTVGGAVNASGIIGTSIAGTTGSVATLLYPSATSDVYMTIGKSTAPDQGVVLVHSVNQGFLAMNGRTASIRWSDSTVTLERTTQVNGILSTNASGTGGTTNSFLQSGQTGAGGIHVGKAVAIDQSINLWWDQASTRGVIGVTGRTHALSLLPNSDAQCTRRFISTTFHSIAATAPEGQGAYLTWNNDSTGRTFLNNQRGSGTGGWVWQGFNSSNISEGEAMTLNHAGDLTLAGNLDQVGKYATYTMSANFGLFNNVWETVGNWVVAPSLTTTDILGFNGSNTWQNNSGRPLCITASWTTYMTTTPPGRFNLRINVSGIEQGRQDGSGPDIATCSCTYVLLNTLTFTLQAYQDSGIGRDINSNSSITRFTYVIHN